MQCYDVLENKNQKGIMIRMRKVNTIKKNNNKSSRNKTIDFEIEEGERYLNRIIDKEDILKGTDVLNKTINGDTFEILELLPEKSVDLLIVDPPYNLTKNYHGNSFDKTSMESYEEYTRSWIEKCVPLLKDEATVYICCDWETSLIIGNVLKDYFNIQNRITWERSKGRGAVTNWKNSMEDIWFATMNKKYTFNVEDVKIRRSVIAPYKVDGKPKDWEETEGGNFRNSFPSNFWGDITIPFWSMAENTAHPTQKSEKLMARLILASSNENDVILDPFLGSGTTSVTAKKLNRQYIGVEGSLQYCTWAEHRLEKAEEDNSIQGYTDGVFWERNTLSSQMKTDKKVQK